MAAKVPADFALRAGVPAPDAIVRLAPGHGFQIFEKTDSEPARIHLIFNLYGSQASYDAGEAPLVDRYQTVDLYNSKVKGMKLGVQDDPGGPNGKDSKRIRATSERVEECLKLCKALAYEVFHDMPENVGFTSDEKTQTVAQAKAAVADVAAAKAAVK